MYHLSLKQLSQQLHDKTLSSAELTGYFLKRINHFDSELNSFITVDEESALNAARKADVMIAKGQASPLTGIPMSHKDIFCTQGIATTCGSMMLASFISPYDAHIVTRLRLAGSVMLGKNNMDEFAMGSSNETSYFHPVKNPWKLDCVPGGSSGGSAAAVAARLVPWATGTDTGGSIRQPAAFCGITGLKPTYGRVSRFGMIAFASSLDQAGPMATNAEDLSMLMNAIAGYDERDSTSVNQQPPDFGAQLSTPIAGMKIGLPRSFFDDRLPAEISDSIHNCAKLLEQQGAVLVDIDLPSLDYAIACYYIISSAEASTNLSRYDGVRFGHRSDKGDTLAQMYAKTRAEGFGDEVKRRILTGTYTLSAGYFDDYYVKAQQVRRLIRDDFISAFKTVDVILGPTTPSTAFKLGEKTKDPVTMYLSDIYTISANLTGLPALSMPAGFHKGLPIGAQLIGRHYDESSLLQLAHQYQQHSNWHQRIAPFADKEVN